MVGIVVYGLVQQNVIVDIKYRCVVHVDGVGVLIVVYFFGVGVGSVGVADDQIVGFGKSRGFFGVEMEQHFGCWGIQKMDVFYGCVVGG